MFLFFFFFQAEDGIRDLTVTGVQTCALPISSIPLWPFHRPASTPDGPASPPSTPRVPAPPTTAGSPPDRPQHPPVSAIAHSRPAEKAPRYTSTAHRGPFSSGNDSPPSRPPTGSPIRCSSEDDRSLPSGPSPRWPTTRHPGFVAVLYKNNIDKR